MKKCKVLSPLKQLFYTPHYRGVVFCFIVLIPAMGFTQWTSQVSNTTTDLYGLHFPDATNGWAVGADGFITKSSDSGANWSSQTSGTIRSRDGIFMIDDNTGFTVGDRAIICSTTDGGAMDWSVTQITGYSGVFMHDVHFPTSDIGYISANSGTVFKTIDGGDNWTDVSVPSAVTRYRGVYFVSSSTGWLVGSGGNIVHTTNGGTSWQNQTSQSGTQLHGVDFIDASNGWVVGTNGIIKKTTDGGVTWVPLTSGVTTLLKAVDFIDASNGWAVGEGGVILRTEDGGASWYQQPADVSEDLHDIQAFSDQVAIAVGVNGTVLKTTNGGGVLPVELAYFNAKTYGEEKVLLNWQTTSELNNNGFEIQWSRTGETWQKIAFINGQGNTHQRVDYSFTHHSPLAGINYYRLKQIDFDGTFSFSAVEVVNFEPTDKGILVYPNPTKNQEIFVALAGETSAIAAYKILTVNGDLLQDGRLIGANEAPVQIALHYEQGVYFLQIVNGDSTITKRIVIQ